MSISRPLGLAAPVAIWLLALVVAPGNALAQSAEKGPTKAERASARDAYDKGTVSFERGDYVTALDSFVKANALIPSVQAMYWIAQAQDKLIVSIWGGSWRDLVAETAAKKFTQETGVQVQFITGGTIDRLNKAKLAKGNPVSDISFTTSHVGWLYANDGL